MMMAAKSDWYGFFTPKGGYHKGYFKHIYEDGSELYQYTEYKLDDTGEPFTIEEAILQFQTSI